MFLVKNRLSLAILIVLAASSAAYGEDWLSRIKLSSTGWNSRQIHLLSFDRSNSNISTTQAAMAMDGFFSGLDTKGSYRINLTRKYQGEALGNTTVLTSGVIFSIATFGLGFLFTPVGRYEYLCTVEIEIRDSKGQLVKKVTKHETYAMSEPLSGRITELHMSRISETFSTAIRKARDELNYHATDINNQLISASQPFEKTFDELSAKIWSNAAVAILPVSGSNTAENNKITGELTRYFLNSGKKYYVVNREYIDKIIRELSLQGTPFWDQSTAVQVGKFVGARVMIVGRLDATSNGRQQLVVQAIDVQSTQTLGISVAQY